LEDPKFTKIRQLIRHKGFVLRMLGCSPISVCRKVKDDKCFLVLSHTPLFMFVRPLALLIFSNFTCFIFFVINRSLHHISIEGAKRT
jgi:hypothetical protein